VRTTKGTDTVMSRFRSSIRSTRSAALAAAVLAVAVVGAIAFAAGPARSAGADPGSLPSAPRSAVPSLAPAATTTPRPIASSTPAPTAVPSPTEVASPTQVPSPTEVASPTEPASPAEPVWDPTNGAKDPDRFAVDVDTFDGHDVALDVFDYTGSVSTVVTGTPGDGASIEPERLDLSNVDARTLALTWVDVPIDRDLDLFLDDTTGHLRIILIQPEPDGGSDAIAFDRQVIVTFDHPVDAGTVEAFLQGGWDTAS
jgi:hypothetical protein